MNILFFNKYYPHPLSGGIERVTMKLSKWFTEQGNHCYSVYYERTSHDYYWDFLKGEYVNDVWNAAFWQETLTTYHINVVINQSHWWITPLLAEITHKMGVKYIFCLHTTSLLDTVHFSTAIRDTGWWKGIAIMLTYPLFRWYSLQKLYKGHRLNYQYADKIVLLTRSAIKDYAKRCRADINEGKLDYINNPLSFNETLSTQDIKKKKKIVLVVARLSKEKRIDILLDVWKIIEKSNVSNWKLKIVGGGEDEKKLKDQVDRLHLRDVSFEGIQESECYYEEASIYCVTSQHEGFPMTILESLQKGVVPVVMDSFPAAKDMIEDGVNGILVPYPDVKVFAEKLMWLMNHDDIRNEMAANAIASSHQYDIERIGKKWEEILNS